MATKIVINFEGKNISLKKSFVEKNYPSFLDPRQNKGSNAQSTSINIDNIVNSVDWVYNYKSHLTKHLEEGHIPSIDKIINNTVELISSLNLAKFNMKYGTEKNVKSVLREIKIYFDRVPDEFVNPYTYEEYLFEALQIIWLFPEFYDELKVILNNYAKLVNSSLCHNCTFGNHLIDSIFKKVNKNITEEMFYKMTKEILDEFKKIQPTKNHLFDVTSLEKILFEPAVLETFPMQKTLGYQEPEEITFSKQKLQARMTQYSNNIINESFPFDSSKFVIAGGFPTNIICGLRSEYTDIDIYIYKDFKETSKTIIDHLLKTYKVELTYNPCIINVILVGSKMNLQLINSKEKHQEVIDKFDLTHSQAMITNWNKIEITLEAFHAYLTGTFEINSNVRINPSRILKAYVKGFKMDTHSIRKAINVEIDNDAKKILDEFKILDAFKITNNIQMVLEKHLKPDSTNFKILTKAIYIPDNFYQDVDADIKKYLENITKFKYLKPNDIENTNFKPLDIYGSKYYGYDFCEKDKDNNKKSNILEKVKFVGVRMKLKNVSNELYLLNAIYENKKDDKHKPFNYSFSTVVDARCFSSSLDGNISFWVNENHPIVNTIKAIETKLANDFAHLGKFKTKLNIYKGKGSSTVYISTVFGKRTNTSYEMTISEDKKKTYAVTHNNDYRKINNASLLQNYIDDVPFNNKTKESNYLVMITLTLRKIIYNPKTKEFTYNITLQPFMKAIDKYEDVCILTESSDEEEI